MAHKRCLDVEPPGKQKQHAHNSTLQCRPFPRTWRSNGQYRGKEGIPVGACVPHTYCCGFHYLAKLEQKAKQVVGVQPTSLHRISKFSRQLCFSQIKKGILTEACGNYTYCCGFSSRAQNERAKTSRRERKDRASRNSTSPEFITETGSKEKKEREHRTVAR